ncbi:uncharacterized protein [Bos indicus]|uniref:Uncharacterized protein n=1 Tax=Bos indicus TaxID=9915 RepID=A0ABM4RTP6_BOSIN
MMQTKFEGPAPRPRSSRHVYNFRSQGPRGRGCLAHSPPPCLRIGQKLPCLLRVLCALPGFQLAAGEPDSEVVLWVRATVQLAALRPRTVGTGVPSWRQLRRRPSLRRQGCGPLPGWRARSLEARPGSRGPSAPRFLALSHTEAGSSSRGCLGAHREGAGLATRRRLRGPPLCKQTAGRAPSSGSWELREVLRAPGAGRFAVPAVTRSGPVVLALSSCLWWRARGGGGRGQEATEPGVCPGRPAWPLVRGFGKCLSPHWCHPPPAPGAGSRFCLGQDLTGAKLWTEEVPGFLEVAGPQAVMPRGADRWMGLGEPSKDFSRSGDQKTGVGWGGGAQEESLEAQGEVSVVARYLRGRKELDTTEQVN